MSQFSLVLVLYLVHFSKPQRGLVESKTLKKENLVTDKCRVMTAVTDVWPLGLSVMSRQAQ